MKRLFCVVLILATSTAVLAQTSKPTAPDDLSSRLASAQQAVSKSKLQMDAALRVASQLLLKDADYVAAKTEFDEADTRRELARKGTDAQDKLNASSEWNTKNKKMQDLKSDFIDGDQDYAAAKLQYDADVTAASRIQIEIGVIAAGESAAKKKAYDAAHPPPKTIIKKTYMNSDGSTNIDSADNIEKGMSKDEAVKALGVSATTESMDSDGNGVLTWSFVTAGIAVQDIIQEPYVYGRAFIYFENGKVARIVKSSQEH